MAAATRVLYVDDEPDLLDIGKEFLEKSGDFIVTTALSATEAIRLLEQEKFDAIISDYQMPGMDGIRYLVEVRTRFGPIPFILFTGRGREEVVIQAINSGADFYLQKGGNPRAQFAELSLKVRSASTRKRAEEALVRDTEELHSAYEELTSSEEELRQNIENLSRQERALRESAQMMSAIVLGSPVPQFVIDRNHRVISWNRALEEYSGVRAQDVLGTTDTWRAFYEEARPVMADLLLDGTINKIPEWYAGKYRPSKYVDGAYEATDFFPKMGTSGIWLYFTASVIRDPDGNIVGAVETLEDVTDIKRAEAELGTKNDELQAANEEITATEEELRANLDELIRQELELRQSEEKLAAVVAGSPVPKFVIDSDHRIIYWNRALEQTTGISAAQVIGTRDQWRAFYDVERPTMADLILDGAFSRISELYAGKFSESPVVTGAFEATDFFLHMGEKGTYLRFMAAPIKNDRGVTLGAVETLIDVTDIKRAEAELGTKNDELQAANEEITATEEELRANLDELIRQERALRESEEKLAAVVAGSPVPKFVIDSDHRIIYWNRALEQTTGISAAQVIGTRDQWRAFYDVERPTMADLILDGAFTRISELYAGKFSESPVVTGAFEATDFFPHMGKKGTYLRFMAAPIKNDRGVTLGAVETLIDVTDIKRAEAELGTKNDELQAANEEITATEEELRANLDELTSQERALRNLNSYNRSLFEASIDPLVTINSEGKITDVNTSTERVTGHSREELIGTDFSDYFTEPELAKEGYKRMFSDGTVRDYPLSIRHNDGHITPVLYNATVYRDETGQISGVFAAARDITDRKLAEDTLFRVNQKLNILSQLTRKDLTNQLFVLSSYLELAKNQLAGQDRIIETLQKGDHAIRLIHETIEYSKDYQDMGAKPPKWQNVKMEMLFGLSHISIGKIQHSLETETLEIYADPLLEKVCQRLFENSLAHGDHVTRIRVWHSVTPEGVTIVFEDDGTGIPQEKKEQIFLRGEGTRVSMRSLIFVREILDITGITIRETGEPGKGARFEMTVPNGSYRMKRADGV
jgi:PAS domain S-box-containing protein